MKAESEGKKRAERVLGVPVEDEDVLCSGGVCAAGSFARCGWALPQPRGGGFTIGDPPPLKFNCPGTEAVFSGRVSFATCPPGSELPQTTTIYPGRVRFL